MQEKGPAAGNELGAGRHIAFRPDLQGFRAVAILLVVLAHAGVSWFAGGFIGVDVFFVLSGYLTTGLLLRELEQTGRIDLLGFYARRLKRLFPALAVVVAVTVGAAYWLLSSFDARAQLASAPYASIWTSNLYFAFTAFGYFDELADRDLFLHSWSLGVEEQFYLLWPILMLSLLLIGPARRFAGSRKNRLAILAVVTLVSLAVSLYWSYGWTNGAFYQMPSRIWHFSLGAVVYVAFAPDLIVSRSRGQADLLRPSMFRMLLVVGFLLIVGSAVGLHTNMTYPGLWALLPSSGSALG